MGIIEYMHHGSARTPYNSKGPPRKNLGEPLLASESTNFQKNSPAAKNLPIQGGCWIFRIQKRGFDKEGREKFRRVETKGGF